MYVYVHMYTPTCIYVYIHTHIQTLHIYKLNLVIAPALTYR